MKNLSAASKRIAALVGGLSAPSKMPCFGWSTPANDCNVGSLLRNVVGSTCSGCYALKGRYVFGNVKRATERRLSILRAGLADGSWERDMIAALSVPEVRATGHFRWHDSGDLQGYPHLEAIVRVAEATPWLKHWLPTREAFLVSKFLGTGRAFPMNLTVRVSLPMMETERPATYDPRITTSGVSREGFSCPASSTNNECRDCRACWDGSVSHVSYKKH